MGQFVERVSALALAFGAPGLFIVAVLDSSFLSLPEIADLLVIWMVTNHKHRFLLYASAATMGSMAGSLVMFYLGKKGGEALIRKRFGTGSIDRAMSAFERHGIMAVLVPSLLPPPAPFKIFVLLAGVVGISAQRFAVAIIIGRGARYLALSLLAVRYGDVAVTYMNEHGVAISLGAVGVLALGFLLYMLWKRARRPERL